MLLQSLSTLCNAPGGAGSIWEYLEAVVRATRVSGRFAYSFRTELHFADVNQFRSNMQSSLTLRVTSPVFLSTSRGSQTHLERCNVLSDSASAFSGAPKST